MPALPVPLLAFAAAVSATLAILSAPWAFGQPWMNGLFKPLTTLLIIAYAWPRGRSRPALRRWVLAGLWLSLCGDVALLWPDRGFLAGLVSFLLAHLAYLRGFTRDGVRLAARPLPFVLYAALAALILWQLWPGVPPGLRVPVLAYVACLAAMAAQAGVLWLISRGGAREALARNAALGGLLFMTSDALLAFNKFHAPVPLSALWILLTYWVAQGLIGGALRARASP